MRLIGLTVVLTLGLILAPLANKAQTEGKVWRIGFLSPFSSEYDTRWRVAFQQGLRDLGYVEGKTVVIEQRHAEGQLGRLADLAGELGRHKVDVFVVHGFPNAIQAARKASGSIPIVFIANPDPVEAGIVTSLAHPGGNVTGLSDLHSEIVGKRLELLKEVVPSASRIAVLVNPDVPILVRQVKDVQVAASALDMRIVPLEVREPDDIDRAFRTMSLERVHALDVLGGAAGIHRKRVAALAIKGRIPTISTTREFAGDGGLISYGASFEDLYRRAATFVDKILKGAKPADLPVEQPTKFELVINLKTAKALGLTIPPEVLGRADEVIE
jgi:putative tryptophan/tyrosine transport system substrate-binding protein